MYCPSTKDKQQIIDPREQPATKRRTDFMSHLFQRGKKRVERNAEPVTLKNVHGCTLGVRASYLLKLSEGLCIVKYCPSTTDKVRITDPREQPVTKRRTDFMSHLF